MEKTVQMPKSWSDVSIRQYEELFKASHDESLDIEEREILIISILSKMPLDEVRELAMSDFIKLSNACKFLNDKPIKHLPNETMKLNGTDYNVTLYVRNMTAAQFLDYKTVAADTTCEDRTARLIAAFVWPVGSTYADGTYDPEKVVEDINEYMSVEEGLALTNFFIIQYRAYAEATLASSVRTLKKLKEIPSQEKKKILEGMKKTKTLLRNIGSL